MPSFIAKLKSESSSLHFNILFGLIIPRVFIIFILQMKAAVKPLQFQSKVSAEPGHTRRSKDGPISSQQLTFSKLTSSCPQTVPSSPQRVGKHLKNQNQIQQLPHRYHTEGDELYEILVTFGTKRGLLLCFGCCCLCFEEENIRR